VYVIIFYSVETSDYKMKRKDCNIKLGEERPVYTLSTPPRIKPLSAEVSAEESAPTSAEAIFASGKLLPVVSAFQRAYSRAHLTLFL
jgi:hypothetical protein